MAHMVTAKARQLGAGAKLLPEKMVRKPRTLVKDVPQVNFAIIHQRFPQIENYRLDILHAGHASIKALTLQARCGNAPDSCRRQSTDAERQKPPSQPDYCSVGALRLLAAPLCFLAWCSSCSFMLSTSPMYSGTTSLIILTISSRSLPWSAASSMRCKA